MRVVDGQCNKTYRVRWEIDIDANTPLQAAQRAQALIMGDPDEHTATVFHVYHRLPPVSMIKVDLACICDDSLPDAEKIQQRMACPAHYQEQEENNEPV